MSTIDEPQNLPGADTSPTPARSAGRAASRLTPDLLGGIASGLARSRATWEPLVAFDDDRPTAELLLPSNRYDVFVESWGPAQELHLDHRSGSCAVTVVAGALVLTETADGVSRADVVTEGTTVVIDAGSAVTLRNLGPAQAVSIHAVEHGTAEP